MFDEVIPLIAFVKRYAGFFLLVLALGGLVVLNLGDPVGAEAAVFTATTAAAQTTTLSVMTVELRGQVASPGKYVLSAGATVADAIALAGGALATADLADLNLTKSVYDGMVLSVPALVSTDAVVYVFVDIKGAVRYPGVYRVADTLRVYDAVMLAGGFLAGADAGTVNLAARVSDAMMIVIPFEAADATEEDETASADDDGRIDINTATLEELDTLYGIGYILAQRIIDYRAEYGAFESIEDIMNVDGIKESVYERIKNDIRV